MGRPRRLGHCARRTMIQGSLFPSLTMARLRPLFLYFGAKWGVAPTYPRPAYPCIIEPFAGSACYSLLYPSHRVMLYDANPRIIAVWRYLINADEGEVLSLPDVPDGVTVDNVTWPTDGAKWLAGFWLNQAVSSPCKRMSKWGRGTPHHFWGPQRRARIASQLWAIRHWTADVSSYNEIPDMPATWFVDPPYIDQGMHYGRFGSRHIDYTHLAEWCKTRSGQTIVCEGDNASWLPFSEHAIGRSASRKNRLSRERVWLNP